MFGGNRWYWVWEASSVMWPVVALALAAGGCVSAPQVRFSDRATPSDSRTCSLYLHASPHSSLHVEVDAVAGCEPGDDVLASLQAFLLAHCDKPEGVRVILDDIILRSDAVGYERVGLAKQYMDGPPATEQSADPAFLYVLYYDTSLEFERLSPPRVSSHKHFQLRREFNQVIPKKPIVRAGSYPAAIFVDRRHVRANTYRRMERLMIKHEAGHVLGLTWNQAHGRGGHCLNSDCFMRAELDVRLWRVLFTPLPTRQKGLCHDCLSDLGAGRMKAADPKLR